MKRLLAFILVFLFILTSTYILCIIKELSTTPVYMTKDFYSIFVDNDKCLADYNIFISVPEEYDALNEIDEDTRHRIAEYMKENNFVLSNGEQEFLRRRYTYDMLIDEFKFETKTEINDLGDTYSTALTN